MQSRISTERVVRRVVSQVELKLTLEEINTIIEALQQPWEGYNPLRRTLAIGLQQALDKAPKAESLVVESDLWNE